MDYLRSFEFADAGDNFLDIELPDGAVLKIVNVRNATTGWLPCSAHLTRVDYENADTRAISLKDRINQPGDADVHWEGSLNMTGAYRKVVAKLEDCIASDVIALTVGFET